MSYFPAKDYWQREASRRRLLRAGVFTGAGLSIAALACSSSNNTNASKPAASVAATSASRPQPAGGSATAAAPSRTATPAAAAVQPRRGGTLRLPVNASPATLDPYRGQNTIVSTAVGRVYSNLWRQVPASSTEPEKFPPTQGVGDVVASLPEITDGGLTYTVKLNPNVKFHPPLSRPLTTDDMIFSLQRIRGDLPGSVPAANASYVSMIDKLEAPDNSTLVFRLKYPTANFLIRMDHSFTMLVFPKETGTAFDPNKAAVGTGGFILKDVTQGVSASYVRNPDWHFGPDAPYLDGLQEFVVPEYASQLNQFLGGNLDQIGSLAIDDLKRITQSFPNASVFGTVSSYMLGIFHSGLDQNAPFWKDVRVRYAMSMALDRNALFEALYSPKGVAAAGLQPPKVKWHSHVSAGQGAWWVDPQGPDFDPKLAQYWKYNPAMSKALLSQAGYPDGLSLEYHYPPAGYGANYKTHAELIGEMLTAAGFKLDVKTEDFQANWVPKILQGNFNGIAVFYLGQQDPGEDMEQHMMPGGTLNFSKLNDPELNSRTQAIQRELDVAKRKSLVKDAQMYLAEKMWWVPAIQEAGPTFEAWAPRVKDAPRYVSFRDSGATRDPYVWIAS